ncbi:hypothetical protein EDB80DRAFT_873033 [Ilyonectria destructans]|nr:hypothetical protein EDB80DRAFT_873033 [Ilyonectria destructans]
MTQKGTACCLDRFGASTGLVALDGCYGEQYFVASPETDSQYNRLVVVAERMNSANWLAVYGESTLVNSLLNRPLEPTGPRTHSPIASIALRLALRTVIVGQWAMAVGASATKDWNSFFICFWVVFCIISHAYTSPRRARFGTGCDRFQVQISSRRALLNTVIALNPDTFALAEATTSPNQCIKNRTLSEQATRWIDPILKPSADRTNWEAATLDALKEVATLAADDQVPEFFRGRNGGLSDVWQGKYKTEKGEDKYWKKFIVEGISVAASIRLQAGLPGRMVSRPSP